MGDGEPYGTDRDGQLVGDVLHPVAADYPRLAAFASSWRYRSRAEFELGLDLIIDGIRGASNADEVSTSAHPQHVLADVGQHQVGLIGATLYSRVSRNFRSTSNSAAKP